MTASRESAITVTMENWKRPLGLIVTRRRRLKIGSSTAPVLFVRLVLIASGFSSSAAPADKARAVGLKLGRFGRTVIPPPSNAPPRSGDRRRAKAAPGEQRLAMG